MFKLLAKLWRWLKRWFIRQPPPPSPPTQPSDLDYENVVLALLSEVAQGKTWGQLQAFLMSRNVNQQRLAAWLQDFGQRWLEKPEVHQELARRLVLLGEGATGELARVARELAEGLLVVPEPDNSVITESAISGGNEQGASLSEVEKLNQLLAGLKGSGYNQKSVPASNSATVSDAEFWVNQGVTLYELGRYEEALAKFDQAISLCIDCYEAWQEKSSLLRKLARYEEALTSSNHAISIKFNDYTLWYNRGNIFGDLSRYEESLVSYDQALYFQPKSKHTLDAKGIILRELGRYEEALVSCNKAISLDPAFPNAWLNQGCVLIKLGRNEEALTSFDQVISLQPDFPQAWGNRGVVLRELARYIRVLLNLGEIEEAQELQRRGADLLQRLLADPKRTTPQKQQLALKSALFNQLTVDLAIQSGDISGALTLAETGKNTCLRWFLGYEEVPELDYRQIQRLLTPTTAAIYWHLSPSALTTFVIVPDALQVVLTQRFAEGNAEVRRGFIDMNDQRSASLQYVLAWEKWLTEWNQRYQAYRSSKENANGTQKKQHPWRHQMVESFQELRAILNISGIIEYLQNQPIENLILIPHRDLHRFPLHYFFPNYTCTYLPSAYSKLRLILEDEENRDDGGKFTINDTPDNCPPLHSLLLVENPKSTPFIQGKATPLSDLPFAEVEAALIRQRFSQVTLIANPNATRESLCQSLQTPHHIFHFTGHGAYNSVNPAQSCLFLHDTDQLTLTDIIHLDLRDYYLACLCACETAMTGDETITDEYVGLVSAFLKAGVTYVISPLWTVESAASALLIVKFYQHLEAEQSPPIALKAAQFWLKTANCKQLVEWLERLIPQLVQHKSLQLVLQDQRDLLDRMENDDPPYCHPYYWAAFTISGFQN